MNEKITSTEIEKYKDSYSETGFWKKLGSAFLQIGEQLILKALTLFYSAKDDNTPKWAKGVIFGSLGYLIAPLDLIPDFIPAAGYTDDMMTITAAISIVALYIKDEHKERAKEQIEALKKKFIR